MTFFLQILEMVLPVLIALGLGWLCNAKKLFGQDGLAALKAIIGNITLPVVLFNAFFTASYSAHMLFIFVVIFCCCSIALGAGFLLRGAVKPYNRFAPFLITGFEGGMLGYALYGLLAGSENVSNFALVDIGQTVFAYTVFLTVLRLSMGKKSSVGVVAHDIFTNPACMGMLLGIVLGVTGLTGVILSSPIGPVVTATVSFVSAPTACLILVVVGYELSFKKYLLKPVLVTTAIRFVVMAALLVVSSLVIFAVIPYDKNLHLALMLLFSLPAPFILPIFADVGDDAEYISTNYSAYTLLTILLFIAISVYNMI